MIQHVAQNSILGALNIQFEDDVIFFREGVLYPPSEVNCWDELPVRQLTNSTCSKTLCYNNDRNK